MKKGIFCLLLFLFVSDTFSQMVEGSRVWTSTLSDFSVSVSRAKSFAIADTLNQKMWGFSVSPEFTVGKFKNNRIISYGLSLQAGLNKQKGETSQYTIGIAPVLSIQRFIKVTDKVYLTPFSRFSLGYEYSSYGTIFSSTGRVNKSIVGSVGIYPFTMTYSVKTKTNFIFTIGRMNLSFFRTVSHLKPQFQEERSISTNLSLNGAINNIGFGIQKQF